MLKFYDYILTIAKPLILLANLFHLPKRKVTGVEYYPWRKDINIGTVLLTKANFELTNLINPAKIKHAAIYVGQIKGGDVCYVAEAVRRGVVLTDLVTFLTTKDVVVVSHPTFIRNKDDFEWELQQNIQDYVGLPYDYLFNLDGKAFYCFELVAMSLKSVYSELQLKCKTIVKGKRIYDENTFLDERFFKVIHDSREK